MKFRPARITSVLRPFTATFWFQSCRIGQMGSWVGSAETKVSKEGSVAQSYTEEVFSKILSYAIKEGMQFLGESPTQAVIIYIEKRHSVKEDEYSKRLETFHRGLTEIFGIGTKFIERHIAENLYGRLGMDFMEQENWTIVEYAEEAKKRVGSCL